MNDADYDINATCEAYELASSFWLIIRPFDLPNLSHRYSQLGSNSRNHSIQEGLVDYSIGGGRQGPPPWAIGFSREFKKDTCELDRKLLGRVLEVLTELAQSDFPFKPRGDTFKPLVGDLSGCWRYRLGDYRLLLRPNVELARLDALALGARGAVYD